MNIITFCFAVHDTTNMLNKDQIKNVTISSYLW